jgi:hypothetical protein
VKKFLSFIKHSLSCSQQPVNGLHSLPPLSVRPHCKHCAFILLRHVCDFIRLLCFVPHSFDLISGNVPSMSLLLSSISLFTYVLISPLLSYPLYSNTSYNLNVSVQLPVRSYFFKIHFNIILISTSGFFQMAPSLQANVTVDTGTVWVKNYNGHGDRARREMLFKGPAHALGRWVPLMQPRTSTALMLYARANPKPNKKYCPCGSCWPSGKEGFKTQLRSHGFIHSVTLAGHVATQHDR